MHRYLGPISGGQGEAGRVASWLSRPDGAALGQRARPPNLNGFMIGFVKLVEIEFTTYCPWLLEI